MTALAADLRARHGVAVHVVVADLSRETAVSEVSSAVSGLGLNVDLLVNNAGFMTYGPFETIDPAKDHAEVMVNIAALVGLSHAFLPGMLERESGGVINIASIAGFQPIPIGRVCCNEGLVISFSVALWEECRDRNVCVLGLCPGTTTTELFEQR